MHLGILQEHGPFYSTPLHTHLSTVHCLNVTVRRSHRRMEKAAERMVRDGEHFTDALGQRTAQESTQETKSEINSHLLQRGGHQ